MLITLALVLILISAIPTTIEIFKKGNDADPLRREIEEENRRRYGS